MIFLDLDQGVLFGGVIYPYEILMGMESNSKNQFCLRYDGKEVATGKIPPEDLEYLQSMILLKQKYSPVLET
jgi:hypothetical protein